MMFITGDTHGLLDAEKLVRLTARRHLTKSDLVLIAGDFGGVWDGKERDEQVLDFYDSMPFTTLFVDGNHENFDLLNALPAETWNGGNIHRIRESIIHLMRGQVYKINGRKVFTFGGGISIDRKFRVEHVSWWPEEEPSAAECEEAMENLAAHHFTVDHIVTHACPETVKKSILSRCVNIKNEDCLTEKFLDQVLEKTKYKHWFCGHYHTDRYIAEYRMDFLYQYVADTRNINRKRK